MEDERVDDLDRDGLLDEITHKNEVNRQLRSELAILKQQYDEAINFTLKIEEFTEENKNLKKQISESRLVIDDLTRRLQISQQTNVELSNIKEKIKENADKAYTDEVNDLKIQLDIAKSENINMNRRFQEQIKSLESTIFTMQSECALYQKQINKIMLVVGNCFNEKFEKPQDLIQKVSFASQQMQKQVTNSKIPNEDDSATVIKEMQNKISSLKKQYQNEKEKRKELQMVVLRFKKKVEQDDLSHEEQITQLKDTINQQLNEIHRLELFNQQKMIVQSNHRHHSSFHSVGCQVSMRDTNEPTEVHDIENFKRQVNNSNVQIEALETNTSMLKMKISALQKQVEETENAKTLISNKFKQMLSKFDELEKELKSTKLENQKQTIKINELQNQLSRNVSSSMIPTKQLESKIKILETTLDNKVNALKNLEKLLSNQKEELKEISLVKDRLLSVIERQNHMLNVYNDLFVQQEREKEKNVSKKDSPYRQGQNDGEKYITVEPKFKWPIEKLPKEIFDIAKDITENDSMSIQSRIKNVFIVINKWIEQCSNNNLKEKKKINDELHSVSQSYEDFKWSIVEFIKAEIINESDEPEDSDSENYQNDDEYDEYDDFNDNNNRKEQAKNKIKERKNKIINMKSNDNQKESEELIKNYLFYVMNKNRINSRKLKEFQESFSYLLKSSDSQNIQNVIEKQKNLTNDNRLLIQKLDEERKKRIGMKKKYRVILTEQAKESNEQISILQKAKENSRQQIEQLQASIKKFQEQNQALLSQIKEQQSQINTAHHKPKIKEIRYKNDYDFIENNVNNDINLNNNNNINRNDLNTSFANKSQSVWEYEDMQYSLENAEKSCNLWKETARKANDEKMNLQNRIQKIMNDYENQINHLNKKHEIEQNQNQRTIFELSQKLKNQAEDNDIAIKKLHDSLDKAQKKFDETVQEIVTLKNENEKLLHSTTANIESVERSKRLSEAQLKAKLLSLDANYSALIDAEKQKSEKEKRELIEYFLNSFRKFCLNQVNNMNDYEEKIDEEYYKFYVSKIREEFEKHQKTDEAIRKLIKANNDDPLEDALTQFIIQNHPQFQDK